MQNILDQSRQQLTDEESMEPIITDKGEVVLSQERIDENIERIKLLIENIQGALRCQNQI